MMVDMKVGHLLSQNVTFQKCGKKVHIMKDCQSKLTGYSGNPSKKSINELPEWVTKKLVFPDTKDLATSTTTRNNNKFKCCTSCNHGNGAFEFHWNMDKTSEKLSKARNYLFAFPILLPM